MIFKKIIIYQYEVLFEILNEIKDNFNLDLFKADKKNLELLKKKVGPNYLVVSNSKNNNLKDQLIIDNVPIRIEKIIEQINLRFLKDKYNSQSDISIGSYILNLNSREISKDGKIVDLTEREVNLILFLKNSQIAINIDKLQKEVWDYGSELETHTVETHIYRLRKKIKEKFKDENFILSSKEGYVIN